MGLLDYNLCIHSGSRKGKLQRKGGAANNNKKLIKEVKALLGSWERKALAVKASTA